MKKVALTQRLLKIVSENDYIPPSPEYSKGWHEGLRRIASLSKEERSKDEMIALLKILRWEVERLEANIAFLSKGEPKLQIVVNK
ncbi:hypothetical protein LCGC14_0547440 [marine sediment metagenome]|uniref:Uncharacterized protein n=1 Tax=marine sediment metagenome TaxID=412755 RepID=A0A0F9UCF7_9ZZZZ